MFSNFFNADFQVLDNCAQRFALQFASVHRNHHAGLVAVSHINCVAASLTPKHETQPLGNAN
jgi:hypothetical protein